MAFARARPLPVDAGSSPEDAPRDVSVCPPENQGGPGDFCGQPITERKPAVVKRVDRLKRRAEFLAVAATGQRWVAPSFVLQAGPPKPVSHAEQAVVGIGFTATKRIGNAVVRNRAKRRLRAAARSVLPDAAAAGRDYVLIARAEVLTCSFQTLLDDLEKAFSRVLTATPRPSRRSQPGGRSRSPAARSPSGL
jgi:ribonuclease P protein component